MDIFGVLILGPQLRVMERSAPYKEKNICMIKVKIIRLILFSILLLLYRYLFIYIYNLIFLIPSGTSTASRTKHSKDCWDVSGALHNLQGRRGLRILQGRSFLLCSKRRISLTDHLLITVALLRAYRSSEYLVPIIHRCQVTRLAEMIASFLKHYLLFDTKFTNSTKLTRYFVL